MRLIKTNMPGLPAGAPTFSETANEAIIRKAGASVWLEGDNRYIKRTAGAFSAWVDRVAGRSFVPGFTLAPALPSEKAGKQAIRFGFGASGLAALTNGALRAEDNASLVPVSGKYTIAYLMRLPLPTGEGGTEGVSSGGTPYGNALTTAGTTGQLRSNFAYGAGTGFVSNQNNGAGLSSLGYGPTNWDDGVWKSIVLSIDPAVPAGNQVIRLDGAAVQTAGVNIGARSADASAGQLIIGAGSGAGVLTAGLVGDMAGFLLIPDVAVHKDNPAALAAIEAHFGAIAAALKS